jgi:hypothetical protein
MVTHINHAKGGALRHLKTRGSALAGTLLVVGAFAAAPAQAHDGCIRQRDNVACTRDGHTTLDACDREADGIWIVAIAYNGRGDRWEIWDTNGSQPGCGNLHKNVPGMTGEYYLRAAHNLYGNTWLIAAGPA